MYRFVVPSHRCRQLWYVHFKSLDRYSYSCGIIHEITSLGFSFKMMYVCGERFLFLLLNLQKTGYGSVDTGVTYFNHNKPLILSQDFPDVMASVIKVHVKPFHFA